MFKQNISGVRPLQKGRTLVSLFLSFILLLNSTFLITQPKVNASPPLPPDEVGSDSSGDDSEQDTVPQAPPSPEEMSAEVERQRAEAAMTVVLSKYLDYLGPRYEATLENVVIEGEWGYGTAVWSSDTKLFGEQIHILAHQNTSHTWQALLPSTSGLFPQWVNAIPTTLINDALKEVILEEVIKTRIWSNQSDNIQNDPFLIFSKDERLFALDLDSSESYFIGNWSGNHNYEANFSSLANINGGKVSFEPPTGTFSNTLGSFYQAVQSPYDATLWANSYYEETSGVGWITITEDEIEVYAASSTEFGLEFAVLPIGWLSEENILLTEFAPFDGRHMNYYILDTGTNSIQAIALSGLTNFSGETIIGPSSHSLLVVDGAELIEVDIAKTEIIRRYQESIEYLWGWLDPSDIEQFLEELNEFNNRTRSEIESSSFLYWPVPSNHSVSCPIDCYPGHHGTDIGTNTDNSTPIYASAGGIVVARVNSQPYGYYRVTSPANGNYVKIDHENGYYSYYLHMTTNIQVSMDERVEAGDLLGYGSNSGLTCGTQAAQYGCFGYVGTFYHLHFEVHGSCGNSSCWVNPYAANLWILNPNGTIADPPPPGTGSCPSVSNKINVHDLINCQGQGYSFTSPGLYDMSSYFNDATESIAVSSGWSARLYLHDSESSPSICISATDGNLWNNTFSDGTVVANQATWMRVYNNTGCSGGTPPGGSWLGKYVEGDTCWWDTNCGNLNTPKCSENISGPELNKNWGTNAPCGGGMSGDNWIGNFETTINFPAGNYVFYVNHDDGLKLWLNGQNIADRGGSGSTYICNGQGGFGLSGNESLRVMLREQGGDAHVDVTWTTNTSVCVPPTPPAPTLSTPSNGASFNEGQDITLVWNSSTNATQYYAEFWGGPAGTINSGWQSGTSWYIGSQWAGYNYSWRVKAKNSSGESGWSSTWNFTVKPAAPSNLTAQSASCSQINLYWNDNSSTEDGFKIYRGGSLVGQVGAGTTSFQNNGLNENTSYFYTVKAFRGSIESNASNTASATTPTCAPPQPDLVPAQWGGWQYPIVPSSITETNTVNNLYANDTTYFDWGLANDGNANSGGDSYGDFYIDDTLIASYNFGNVLAGQSWAFLDWQSTVANPGWHTLKVVVDPDDLIAESDETNNTWERQFYWIGSAPYFDNMETGTNDWDPSSSLWHQVGPGSPYLDYYSPTHSWWYGQDSTGNYNTGAANAGTLTMPPLHIPSVGYYLRFRYWYETETQWTQYDQRWLQIAVDGGPFNNVLQLYDDPMNTWLEGPIIDLSSYAGQTIQLRYYFNTVDSVFNDYRGWYIDDVSISTTPPPTCADPYEPNDGTTEATPISYGQSLSGDMCPNGDYDYFTFTGNADDNVVIDLDAMSEGSLLDPYVYLIDSDGTTVLAEHDDEILGEVRDSKLAYRLTHDGTYYIKLKAWDHPSAGSPNHYYTINLYTDDNNPTTAITSPLNNAWIDPLNETIQATAADAESGVNRVEFLWHDNNWSNQDWVWLGADNDGRDGWSFNFDTGTLPEQRGAAFHVWAFDWSGNWIGTSSWNLGIDRTSPSVAADAYPLYGDAPFIDFWVSWWNSSDNLSGIANYDVQYREGAGGTWTDLEVATTNTYTRFVGIDGNTYYFRARAQDNAGNQSLYSSSDDQHTVQTCPIAADGFEIDDSFSTASLIAPNGITQTHNIHQEGDPDWVTFFASSSVTYTLKTDNSGGHADTRLYLFDTDGTTLLASNDDDPNNWPSSRIDWQPDADGYYFAKVDHWDPWAYGCTTTYGLVILTDDTTPPTGTILINDGDQYATSTSVALTLSGNDSGAGVDQMMLSNNSGFPGAQWQPFDSSVNWVLPSGNGPKTVYVRYRDWAGNISSTFSDDIILDVTTPESSASSPVYTNTSPIEVDWTALDPVVEQGQGILLIESVELWVKIGGGNWAATGLIQTGNSGTFSYPTVADDTYCFATVATDSAGNQEPAPTGSGDSCTTYDATLPQSTAVSPDYANNSFNVNWTAADNPAGIDEVALWVSELGGAWSTTGLTQTGSSGAFSYFPSAGNGSYCFATVALDNATNQESLPTGNGDTCTTFDTLPPSGTILIDNGAVYAATTSVTLTLSSTDSGAGVDQMMLSNQPGLPGASWQSYTDTLGWNLLPGNGLKTVYVRYRDLAGNISQVYTDSIILDATTPQSIASSPDYANLSPIPVQWTASDTFTEQGFLVVDTVELWVKIGNGSWTPTGIIQTGNSGTFNYPAGGDELYCFATVATDVAGNQEPLPTGNGDSCTAFDTTAPSSAADSPQYANNTFDVDWTADDNLAGIGTVALWYRVGTSAWVSSGLTQTGTIGTFQFTPVDGDENYCFATVADDLAGNQEGPPTGSGDSCTIFDTSPPSSEANAPPEANAGQVQVSWSADDTFSGVAAVTLWVRFEGGAWQDTGLPAQSGASGEFTYTFEYGPGIYEFATRAVDNAGNDEGVPVTADATTQFSTFMIFTPIVLRQ